MTSAPWDMTTGRTLIQVAAVDGGIEISLTDLDYTAGGVTARLDQETVYQLMNALHRAAIEALPPH